LRSRANAALSALWRRRNLAREQARDDDQRRNLGLEIAKAKENRRSPGLIAVEKEKYLAQRWGGGS
jgi:hypothetical protein